MPHFAARALTQQWSFDGFTDWPGAVEELIHSHGWLAENKQPDAALAAAA